MPFVWAIQCLESKDTNPADVYPYWLAVVAHLHDLITKDSDKSKYTTESKEHICQIANKRFSESINGKHTSNVYLATIILDPSKHCQAFFSMIILRKFSENWAAPILANPNHLSIPSFTLVPSTHNTEASVWPKKTVINGVGLSLLRLLQKEYGNEYWEGQSAEEAQKAMQDASPYLAQHTPIDAIAALKKKYQDYLDGKEPFNRKHAQLESLWEYWLWFVNDDNLAVLAVC